MFYTCLPADHGHYASSLTLDAESAFLRWVSLPGQGSLIVRTPYGQEVAEIPRKPDAEPDFHVFEELLNASCPNGLPEKHYVKLPNGFYIRYVSAQERAKNNGCPAYGEACSYIVFPCLVEPYDERCTVYTSIRRGSLSAPFCDAPLHVRIDVEPVYATTRKFLFFRDSAPTEFFRLIFLEPCDENYRDGDLEYRVENRESRDENWRIPITRAMFQQGEIYVRASQKPTLISCNEGVKLAPN